MRRVIRVRESFPPVLDVFSAAICRSFHKRLFPDQVWGVGYGTRVWGMKCVGCGGRSFLFPDQVWGMKGAQSMEGQVSMRAIREGP